MSSIIVDLAGVPGSKTVTIGETSYKDHINCKGMMHSIDLPLAVATNARTEGASTHGPVGLVHEFDKASPLLRAAASGGTMCATAKIYRTRMSGGSAEIAEKITLTTVYVVRIDVDTYLSDLNQPTDTILETFWLEYSSISWDYKYKASASAAPTSVVKTWSPSTLSQS